MQKIEILSPAAPGPLQRRALSPGLTSLEGRTLGIRRDHTWRSFEIFADEVERLATQNLGVQRVVRFDPEARIGSPEQESARVEEFARTVDAAIVGLGT